MLTINYITRPYFNDIALELIQELKKKCTLNVIIIVSPWHINYFMTKGKPIVDTGKPFILTTEIKEKLLARYSTYFTGANVIFKYEEVKESSLKNAFSWIKLLSIHKIVLKADLTILETLTLADWYLLLKLRNKKLYYIVHDPVSHTGEARRRIDIIRSIYFKYIDKFILYSAFATELFKSNYEQFAYKTITLQTPVYHSQKNEVTPAVGAYKKQILFFGRISPYKGVELFYSAAETLSKEFENVLFIIAGKAQSNYSPEFLKSNPHKNIRILDEFIDQDKLSELMIGSDYCVLPYIDATQSGVVMTCYAFEMPVLVSDCPGLLEYCFDTDNFSFRNGNINDLINKMRTLLQEPQKLAAYKEKIVAYSDRNISSQNTDIILKSLTN